MNYRVRALQPADIPAAMRIKEAAGWNQTETDWKNLLRLAPETCFGLECDGALAATATSVCYGRRLAWIGMVLTDPAHRRRGCARRLAEHAIEAVTARGVDWIKLDATEMGAPLYARLGFVAEGGVERWGRVASESTEGGERLAWTGREAYPGDLRAFGADRSELLDALAPLGMAASDGDGYGLARPGSRAVDWGPCVSTRAETAGKLLGWFLERIAGQPVCWDLLAANTEAVRLAREFGFAPERRLVRMVLPGRTGAAPLEHDDSQVFAIAGFEYG